MLFARNVFTMTSALALFIAITLGVISSQNDLASADQIEGSTEDFWVQDKSFFRCYPPHHNGSAILLGMDEALVDIKGYKIDSDFTVYSQSDVCHECPCINITTVPAYKNVSCVLHTSFPLKFIIKEHGSTGKIQREFCRVHKRLYEHAPYELFFDNISRNENKTCNIVTEDEQKDPNVPIYIAIAILLMLGLLFSIVEYLYRKGYLYRVAICMPYERLINSDLGLPAEVMPQEQSQTVNCDESIPRPPVKERLKSLDTFRGLSLVVMIFVNYKGGGYWFFHHSAWNGLTVADLVFPWFTFIMGTSIALAFHSQAKRGTKKVAMFWKVFKRTVILFTLGLMISNDGSKGTVELRSLRIPGVLQRLAITYFVVAFIHVFFAGKEQSLITSETGHKRYFLDIWPYWLEWIINLSFLAAHICLTFLLNVPGCPTGYIGPGGLHQYPEYENCSYTGGAAGYIDHVVFGENHIYGHPTCMIPYQTTEKYDPEGILGTLTSIFMCFLGLQAGKIIICHKGHLQRIVRWLAWSVLLGVVAGVLCGFSQEGGTIPVNKNLWSVSFILALASMAYILLVVCYVLIDILRLWSGAPFIYPGMNSIVIYMCHEVFHSYFPVQFAVKETHAAQLAMNLYGTILWTIVAAVMYHKKTFIAI